MPIIEASELEQIRSLLQQRLNKHRFQHSLGVADTARDLALHYGEDPEKAYLAGLVHDYAKNMPEDELIQLAKAHHLYFDPIELDLPKVLHATVGAWLLPRETVIKDPEILQAVAYHTLGNEQMTLFDKIIYVADIVEPNRDLPDLEAERKLAFENLDLEMIRSLEYNIKHSLKTGKLLHPLAVVLRNACLKNVEKTERAKKITD